MRKFIATWDLHWGHERKHGHKKPLHDAKAWEAVLKFGEDFKPDEWILGGDILDCGTISHHNKHKPRKTEGLRLASDAEECHRQVILPVEQLAPKRTFITGNHEAWIDDLLDESPTLEGLISVSSLLGLDEWHVIPQGGFYRLGKIIFIHGDQLSGGEHAAKNAVITYEENVRFGHFHTFQVFTKTSPVEHVLGRTGIAVPCLCRKDPQYGKGKPNKWMQGFNWGYIHNDGTFSDYVSVIIGGKFVANGKEYRG